MKADNSRVTFRPDRHYRDVVKQQGRVDMDADLNEQQAINVHRTETEAVDVIGQSGAPVHAAGFDITTDGTTLRIGAGRYYVDGVLCENDVDALDYRQQPHRRNVADLLEELRDADARAGLVYLDVWLRHVTALQDPLIREVALGGPDTATRTQVVWQVKVLPVKRLVPDRERLARAQTKQAELQAKLAAMLAAGEDVSALVQELATVNREIAALLEGFANSAFSCDSRLAAWDELAASPAGRLNARTSPTPPTTDLCQLPPRAGYQRTENQLYRVEVHQGGGLGQATFKWSRDNGSVVTSVDAVQGQDVVVRNPGPDDVLGFAGNQWVELSDDARELEGAAAPLIQIDQVLDGSRSLTMKTTPPAVDPALRPVLRRWDQSGTSATANGVVITGGWQPLEDGVEVQFSAGPFRSGDYWLIPARVATGEVEWPPFEIPNDHPQPQPPRGVQHHYSRLAVVESDGERLTVTADCRKRFAPLTEVGAPTRPPAMHVREMSWRNDARLPLAEFIEKGLFIVFDRAPEAGSVSGRTWIVTLELPILPDTGFEGAGTARELAPRLSVILTGEVMTNEAQVRWLPVRNSLQSLAPFFRGLQQVIGRVTLKGAVIWAGESGRRQYLDGRALGLRTREGEGEPARTDLILPSGSGAASSDFESWFLLTLPMGLGGVTIAPASVRMIQRENSFVFISESTGGVVEVMGTVMLTAAATADVRVKLSAGDARELIELPDLVEVPAGATSTRFPIKPGRRPPHGAEQIQITASAFDTQVTAALRVSAG